MTNPAMAEFFRVEFCLVRRERNGYFLRQPAEIGQLLSGGLEPWAQDNQIVPTQESFRPAVSGTPLELPFVKSTQGKEGEEALHLALEKGQVPG